MKGQPNPPVFCAIGFLCILEFGISIFQDKIGRHGKDCWLGRGDGAGLAMAVFAMDLIRWIPGSDATDRSTLFSPTRREPSPKMRWSLHIAAWGTPWNLYEFAVKIRQLPMPRWMNQRFGNVWHFDTKVCHENEDARDLGDFRMNPKLAEKDQATNICWSWKGADFCEAFNGLHHFPMWVFPKMVVPQNGWFIVENHGKPY